MAELKFKTPEAMQSAVDAYFDDCDINEKPYTMSGLALALGMDRRSLVNYAERDAFFPTIKKARAKCESYAEEQLFIGRNAAGVIFNLKNNYDWRDKTEQQVEMALSRKEELTDDELAAIAAGGRAGASKTKGGAE